VLDFKLYFTRDKPLENNVMVMAKLLKTGIKTLIPNESVTDTSKQLITCCQFVTAVNQTACIHILHSM